MKTEFSWNTLDDVEWWFDIGISYQKTHYHPEKRRVLAFAIGIATIYFRW
jgi:hypothetical protein